MRLPGLILFHKSIRFHSFHSIIVWDAIFFEEFSGDILNLFNKYCPIIQKSVTEKKTHSNFQKIRVSLPKHEKQCL